MPAKNKCDPKVERRSYCWALSDKGVQCLSELQELLGLSLPSEVVEHALVELRHSDRVVERQSRMILCEAARSAANDQAKTFLATCLISSKVQGVDSPK